MSWVEAEIREQPEALERFLAAEQGNAVALARELVQADVRYLLIASRGSSGNAARYAQYLFAAANRLPTAFATPSVYTLYDTSPRLDGALAIAISQSGASPDVVEVLAEARRQGRPTLAITNDPASPLAEAAEWTLSLHAGEERAVAATKTYLNSVAAVALLSAALARDEDRLRELRGAPGWVEEQIARSFEDSARLDAYRDIETGSVVGRGVNYGTGFEIALKIRELTGIAFEPWSPPDLLHGPIAALKPGRPVIVVAPSGPVLESMRDFVEKLRERGPELITISDDPALLDAANTALPLARTTPEWLSPLLTVIPGQVAALRLATLKGIDVDRPLGLTKVTLTR
jgi:glutamine---fructose-6-phosphate transaminase (isomerizing)